MEHVVLLADPAAMAAEVDEVEAGVRCTAVDGGTVLEALLDRRVPAHRDQGADGVGAGGRDRVAPGATA